MKEILVNNIQKAFSNQDSKEFMYVYSDISMSKMLYEVYNTGCPKQLDFRYFDIRKYCRF